MRGVDYFLINSSSVPSQMFAALLSLPKSKYSTTDCVKQKLAQCITIMRFCFLLQFFITFHSLPSLLGSIVSYQPAQFVSYCMVCALLIHCAKINFFQNCEMFKLCSKNCATQVLEPQIRECSIQN